MPDAVRQEDEAFVVFDALQCQPVGAEAPRKEWRPGAEHHRRDPEQDLVQETSIGELAFCSVLDL